MLWDAVKNNKVDVIEAILKSGFNVNLHVMDNRMTILMLASTISSNQEIFDTILKYNPIVNQTGSGGKTALHFAANAGNEVAIQNLVQ